MVYDGGSPRQRRLGDQEPQRMGLARPAGERGGCSACRSTAGPPTTPTPEHRGHPSGQGRHRTDTDTHRPNRHAGTQPRQPARSAAERPVGPGASLGLAAAPVGMIDDVTATTPTAPAPAPAPQAPAVAARAVRRAQARDLTNAAAARWLTTEATTQLGRAITLSITRYARDHRQQPTWADALNGVDPTLCEPMTTTPAD